MRGIRATPGAKDHEMHVSKAKTERMHSPLNLPARFASDRRVKTRKAANEALRVARSVASAGGLEAAPDEAAMFRALHTCAYHATRRLRFKRAAAAERSKWTRRWKRIRDAIVEGNLGLVWCMVTQFGSPAVDRDELGSAAMMALVRAVDGFNPWLGFRFSTYACNAIRRSLLLCARTQVRDRMRFPLEQGPWLDTPSLVGDTRLDLCIDRLSQALESNLGELTECEAMILGGRFPMDGSPGLTLGEIGNAIGLSKERVRQIQKKALSKLRQVLEADPLLQ